eukprot:715333-Amphidinium_carterae.1
MQFAMSKVMGGMSNPTEADWCRLKAVTRYVHMYKRMRWHFQYQDMVGAVELDVFTDSDYAGDVSRRSVDCVHEFMGRHLLDTSTTQQQLIALSSGEAEYYALVRG